MSSSRPQSGASLNPSDFATAFNTPMLDAPNLELGAPGTQGQEVISHNTADVSPTPSTPIARNAHTPLPVEGDGLEPPKPLGSASNLSSNRDSFKRDSYDPYLNNSRLLREATQTSNDPEREDRAPSKRRTPKLILAALAALIIVVLAVVIPVYFTVIKKKDNSSNSSASGGGSSSGGGGGKGPGSSSSVTSGGDGSTVTTETGEQFTYTNPFGGFCEYSIHSIRLILPNLSSYC